MKTKYAVVFILIVSLCGCSMARMAENVVTISKTVSTVHETTKNIIGRKMQTVSETVVSDTLLIE